MAGNVPTPAAALLRRFVQPEVPFETHQGVGNGEKSPAASREPRDDARAGEQGRAVADPPPRAEPRHAARATSSAQAKKGAHPEAPRQEAPQEPPRNYAARPSILARRRQKTAASSAREPGVMDSSPCTMAGG